MAHAHRPTFLRNPSGAKTMADTSQAAAWPKQTPLKRPLFPLGKVVATPGALSLFEASNTSPLEYLFRHVLGDWGELDAEDRQANEAALVHGTRIVSSYRLQGRAPDLAHHRSRPQCHHVPAARGVLT